MRTNIWSLNNDVSLFFLRFLKVFMLQGINVSISTIKPQEINTEEIYNKQFQEKVFSEQIDILYKNLFLSVPSSFLCATIVFVSLYRIPHTYLLIYWYMAMILISILRMVHAGLYVRDHKCTSLRFYIFLLMTSLSAVLWGGAGSLLMPDEHHVEQMIVIVVIAGVAAGGIQSLQPSLVACLIYINLLILPLSCWVFFQNEVSYTILGISVVLYLLFNLAIAFRGYGFLKQTLKLKYLNIDLAENLSAKNKQLIEINQDIQEKENNLRLIHDNAPIGMAIVSLEGQWLSVNNKLCEIVGYSKNELEKLTIQDITYQEDLETDMDSRTKLLSGKLQSYQVEKRYVNINNELIWIVTNVSLVRGKEDKPLYYISQIQDINDRKQNETIISWLSKMNAMLQLCHDSEEAYNIISHTASEIFSGLSGGLAVFNKYTNNQETACTWGDNPLLKSSFTSDDCWAFRSGNIYISSNPKIDETCHHFDPLPSSTYICIPLIVQSQVLGMLNFSALAGHIITSYQRQVINNFSEIIKLSLSNIQLKEALSEQAIHDPLTELLNRRYLYDVLPQMLQHTIRTKRILSVCMIDLDYFKRINDQYGHEAGDEVLKYIGTLLKNSFREGDISCRFGGEEFIAILIGSDLKHANTKMEHIRLEMANARINVQNRLLPPITISVGIAEAPQHGQTVSEILRAADSALYVAKERGRNRIISFDSNEIENLSDKDGE